MRFSRFPLGAAAWCPTVRGVALARLAAVACIVGLTLAFAWPAPTTGQADPDAPVGVFTVSLGEADLPPDLPGASALRGQWTLALNEDGTYTVARQDVGEIAAGTYEVDGATLTLSGWGGRILCGGAETASAGGESGGVRYAWELSGEQLTLTPIEDTCRERSVLLGTRPFGGFQACSVAPLAALAGSRGLGVTPPAGADDDERPVATPVGPDATPEAGAAATVVAGGDVEAAIDALLQQAVGCWAAGDPARFLALHSEAELASLAAQGVPLPDLVALLEQVMATPLSFRRIGEVTLTDPNHAQAYVEFTFAEQVGVAPLPFVRQDGDWLFDVIFFLAFIGPPPAP